jgi:hypothetical protein
MFGWNSQIEHRLRFQGTRALLQHHLSVRTKKTFDASPTRELVREALPYLRPFKHLSSGPQLMFNEGFFDAVPAWSTRPLH